MKKIFALILAVMMIFGCAASFASCGGDDQEDVGGGNSKLAYGKDLLAVATQLDALNGLKKGDADIAVIDSVMANYYMNTGDSYKDFQILEGVILKNEEYGIGAKKGNDALIGKINEALIALVADEYADIAEFYGLTDELLVKEDTQNPKADATDDSWSKLANDENAKLVIGYTKFAPIAYDDGDGADSELIGFDIELARAVVEYLNDTYDTSIEIEFIVIDWNSKETMLENGDIDLVWNGMTITAERSDKMSMSIPYLANKQVAVVSKADASKYGTNLEEFKTKTSDCIFIVEDGSAGDELICPED